MEHIGNKLKSLREKRGWSQEQLAKHLGISLRSYQDVEKTGTVKKSETMDRINLFMMSQTGEVSPFTQLIAEPDPHPLKDIGYISISVHERIAELQDDKQVLKNSIELSLNAIKISLNSILEGQSDLKSYVQETGNRTLTLLRMAANLQDLLEGGHPPPKAAGSGNLKSGKTHGGQ